MKYIILALSFRPNLQYLLHDFKQTEKLGHKYSNFEILANISNPCYKRGRGGSINFFFDEMFESLGNSVVGDPQIAYIKIM